MNGNGGPPPDDDTPPWRKGVTGVKGVTPPGRRLSDDSEPRPTKWSASGVQGVVPPGRATPSALNPRLDPNARRLKANKRVLERRKGSVDARMEPEVDRPLAGFVPDVFADVWDPPDLQDFLKLLSDFLEEHPPDEDAIDDIDRLIVQSQAPFELIVGFTIMSAMVRRDEALRQDFAPPLERGANAFFNLARRLNPHVRIPRGMIPESMDALFYDLPDLALQVPFAFATDAFVRVMVLLRDEANEAYDERLITFALKLRGRFIESRSFGDQPLSRLFPWSLPEWTPPSFGKE